MSFALCTCTTTNIKVHSTEASEHDSVHALRTRGQLRLRQGQSEQAHGHRAGTNRHFRHAGQGKSASVILQLVSSAFVHVRCILLPCRLCLSQSCFSCRFCNVRLRASNRASMCVKGIQLGSWKKQALRMIRYTSILPRNSYFWRQQMLDILEPALICGSLR